MLASMETWLRQGRRSMEKLWRRPGVRKGAWGCFWWSVGFFLSAGGIGGFCQPLALGAVCAVRGWQAVLSGLGAMGGYFVFWGRAGAVGAVWAAFGMLMALTFGKRKEMEEYPLLLPAFSGVLVAVTGLVWLFAAQDRTPDRKSVV